MEVIIAEFYPFISHKLVLFVVGPFESVKLNEGGCKPPHR
ncbi:hypothetical protein D1AOALGA4SA_5861 [Olavius algarvensis Delta 1 endosymbiont]|nr:hypothetical protein D1AOALGA4SA_5861 [Olavius algarvensis Delta 1 endosymbiont]